MQSHIMEPCLSISEMNSNIKLIRKLSSLWLSEDDINLFMTTINTVLSETCLQEIEKVVREYLFCDKCAVIVNLQKHMECCCLDCFKMQRRRTKCVNCKSIYQFNHDCTIPMDELYSLYSHKTCPVCNKEFQTNFQMRRHLERGFCGDVSLKNI